MGEIQIQQQYGFGIMSKGRKTKLDSSQQLRIINTSKKIIQKETTKAQVESVVGPFTHYTINYILVVLNFVISFPFCFC